MSSLARVGIIGAGISGLATAFFLRQESLLRGLEMELSLFERGEHLGGVVQTREVGEFLLEAGPEAFVSSKPAILELVEELGLSQEIIGSNDQLRQTYVVDRGQLHRLPDGMTFLAPVRVRPFWATPLISKRGKVRALFEPFVGRSSGDLNARTFLQRRLGREVTEKIAEPLVSAIYGGDLGQLSAASALPETYQVEQKFGSLWKGLRAIAENRVSSSSSYFLTPRRGMSRLIDGLTDRLRGVSIHRGMAGIKIHRDLASYRLKAANFEETFDLLILCTPASATAEIIRPTAPEAAHDLNAIQYSSTAIVFLAYKRAEFSHPLGGFGFVVPEKEATVLDACTWVSSKFVGRCPPDHVLLRCAIHDGRRPRAQVSDEQAAETVHEEIKRILRISCAPALSRVFRVGKAMPQLNVGHARRLERIRRTLSKHPGLFVSGAFYTGVGVPDCTRAARQTAKAAIEFIESRTRQT